MKIVKASAEIVKMKSPEEIMLNIEEAGRTCYKSEDKITFGSAHKHIKALIKSGHESVIEHESATVKFICDRGFSHELVRHRLSSFSQESTRYANYSKDKFNNEITVISPCFWYTDSLEFSIWEDAMQKCEISYLDLLKNGSSSEMARSVLPTSLKTEVIMTSNFRQWRTVLNQRCSKKAHPQMREVMIPLLKEFYSRIPVLFQDLYDKYIKEVKNE